MPSAKRLIKSSKLCFHDVGLACYLIGIETAGRVAAKLRVMETAAGRDAEKGERSSVKPEQRRRGPRPLAAAALSALWPGLGHFGHRNRRALAFATATLVVVAVGLLYFLTRDMRTWLARSITRRWLWALTAAALCVLVLRWAAAFDACRTAARRYPPRGGVLRRSGTLMVLTVLALFIAAPHLVLVRFAAIQLTLLSEVFNATDTQTVRPTPIITVVAAARAGGGPQEGIPAAAVAPDTVVAAASDTVVAAARAGGGPQEGIPAAAVAPDTVVAAASDTVVAAARAGGGPQEGIPAAAVAPDTTTAQMVTSPSDAAHGKDPHFAAMAPPADWDGEERLTVVLLGSDGGYRRWGVRTDTIIVFSIDVATGDAAAFNIPRNWRHVTFPEGTAASRLWPDGYPGIANEIYGLGSRYPEAFPSVEDKGGHSVKSALAQLTGLGIQYYVMVDMVGFVKAVDLFGGIYVHASEWINDRIQPIEEGGPHIDIVIEPGEHHFDGLTALGYVRSRTQSTDWHRMTRQRCVIEALVDQVSPLEAVSRFADISDIISQHLVTDIPLERLEDIIAVAGSLDTSRIVTVNFIPPKFPRGNAPIRQVREAVTRALEGTANKSNALLSASCKGRQ